MNWEVSYLLLLGPEGFQLSFTSFMLISLLGPSLTAQTIWLQSQEFWFPTGNIFLFSTKVPSENSGASLRGSSPLCIDGDLPRFGTNPRKVSPYPRSVSSPRIADPSIRHWASVVKGNFFWKESKCCNESYFPYSSVASKTAKSQILAKVFYQLWNKLTLK